VDTNKEEEMFFILQTCKGYYSLVGLINKNLTNNTFSDFQFFIIINDIKCLKQQWV